MRDGSAIPVRCHDVIVVGSGLAGIASALALAPRSVALITKTAYLKGGSSCWAKGGIAAAIGAGDTPARHAADTIAAGAGISDSRRALRMTSEGVEALKWLVSQGVPFDRQPDGELALAREAAHRHPRIVHAGGDATGDVLMTALVKRVRQTPSISVLVDTFACELIASHAQVQGILSWSPAEGWVSHRCSTVVLATGGIGMTWWHTTNPAESTGDGLAMAARAGAELADMEFVQFHPTALAVDSENSGGSMPLLTEALRGAGASLIDEAGRRFMSREHADAELAPRDVVARAIQRRMNSGQRSFLDLRALLTNRDEAGFPRAFAAAKGAGLNPRMEPLPIAPAAHFHMGGIRIDDRGRTTLKGLWACGEVAATGIHGANRLASNSLLEALVYARRVAADISHFVPSGKIEPWPLPTIPTIAPDGARDQIRSIVNTARQLMSRHVGVLRSGRGLEAAYAQLASLDACLTRLTHIDESNGAPSNEVTLLWGEARNLLLVARLVTRAAIQREESRGAHFRDDYPAPRAEWQRHQAFAIDGLSDPGSKTSPAAAG